jgi:hypothetical protein
VLVADDAGWSGAWCMMTGSPYRDLFSDVILKLQEDQTLQMLFNRWWREKDGAGLCDIEEKGKKDANALSIANVGGVFVVLAAGLLLSAIAAVAEFAWNARSHPPTSTGGLKVVYAPCHH